ncbi:transposase [Bradyrhizobium icense]|uniref:Transposase n=1 Tax=Bradyrhizobium icense TaxID=1274631 RepID=A0A1B1UJX9_9BRAD|nr:transposase [Bradyrhizobium icense]ANW02983.1 hypothetical protein LMTR13_25335 [Bradyrhizobium icense]
MAEKLRIVEDSLTAEMSIVEVARRHRVHPHQSYGLRRQARLGLLGSDVAVAQKRRFVPIAVAPAESKVCEQPKAAVGDAAPIIELVLRNGRLLPLPER